jgi:hypothetical protein
VDASHVDDLETNFVIDLFSPPPPSNRIAILTDLLKQPENKECADCGAKGASSILFALPYTFSNLFNL